MRHVSTPEVREIADRFHIEVDDERAGELRDRVNGWLDGLDGLFDIPVDGFDGTVSRSWRTPQDNPYNAIAVDCQIPPSETGPLEDVTVGIKDIIAVGGVPMQCASAVMRGYVPGFDAAVVDRLRRAGATITAKTGLDEFAASGSGMTGADGPIRNPHDPARTAGGSSGGSAAAVAAGRVDAALGTDTGGSVRIPAAFCGIVGLKPSYGLVPLHGVVENTYTQDHVGPMAPTVHEVARVLAAIAGPDDRDPASLQAAGRDAYRHGGYVDAVTDPPALDSITLGLIEEGVGDGVTDGVMDRMDATIDGLEDNGGTIIRVSVEDFDRVAAVKDTVSLVELAAHWRDGAAPYRRGGAVDEGFQAAFASRARSNSGELGTHYASKLLAGARIIESHGGHPYVRAQAAREVLHRETIRELEVVDALCLPTMPGGAPLIEEAYDPGFDYGRNTRLADVTRLPSITLPNGRIGGLPVGFQLLGAAFDEAALLGVAERIEAHVAR